VKKTLLAQWRANFFTGLAVLLPAIASVVLLVWFFGRVANITDMLLFFLPSCLTHKAGGVGELYLYWCLADMVSAVMFIRLV